MVGFGVFSCAGNMLLLVVLNEHCHFWRNSRIASSFNSLMLFLTFFFSFLRNLDSIKSWKLDFLPSIWIEELNLESIDDVLSFEMTCLRETFFLIGLFVIFLFFMALILRRLSLSMSFSIISTAILIVKILSSVFNIQRFEDYKESSKLWLTVFCSTHIMNMMNTFKNGSFPQCWLPFTQPQYRTLNFRVNTSISIFLNFNLSANSETFKNSLLADFLNIITSDYFSGLREVGPENIWCFQPGLLCFWHLIGGIPYWGEAECWPFVIVIGYLHVDLVQHRLCDSTDLIYQIF